MKVLRTASLGSNFTGSYKKKSVILFITFYSAFSATIYSAFSTNFNSAFIMQVLYTSISTLNACTIRARVALAQFVDTYVTIV